MRTKKQVMIVLGLLIAMILSAGAAYAESSSKNVETIMHRGTGPLSIWLPDGKGRNLYSENTRPALLKGARSGASGVEYDLQQSRDNVLVVHHDLTINRMTRGSGFISRHSASWSFRFRTPSGARTTSFKPTFRSLAAKKAQQQMELKPGGYRYKTFKRMKAVVKKFSTDDSLLMFTASETRTLCRVKGFLPDVRRGLIARGTHKRFAVKQVNAKCVDYLMFDAQALTRRYVKQVLRAGFQLSARRVTSLVQRNRLESWGVSRFVLDWGSIRGVNFRKIVNP